MQEQPEIVAQVVKDGERQKQLRSPETITLPWLVRHMSVGGWFTGLGVLSAVFILGLKVPFLPISEYLGIGVPNEIARLNDIASDLNNKLLDSNMSFSEEVKKVKELSTEISRMVSKRNSLREQNDQLDLELTRTKGLLSEKEKQHRKALKKLRKFQVSPGTTKSPVVEPVKVVSEKFFISKRGSPWISPDFDVTLSLVTVNLGNRPTLRGTPWPKSTTFSIGDIFDLPTSSGLYRFIITEASFVASTATLKVLKVDNGG